MSLSPCLANTRPWVRFPPLQKAKQAIKTKLDLVRVSIHFLPSPAWQVELLTEALAKLYGTNSSRGISQTPTRYYRGNFQSNKKPKIIAIRVSAMMTQ
jgi:hypothetical protein